MIHLPQETCTGCSACAMLCPAHAITMQEDRKGFLRPVIDPQTCIHCQLCLRHCPAQNKASEHHTPDHGVYAAVTTEDPVHRRSQSGGAFYVLGRSILKQDGVVYGAAQDPSYNTSHIRAANDQDLRRLQGSKYVQSDMRDTFRQVGDDLQQKTMVLFSGTPCQVAGLYAYLSAKNISADALLTASIVCYGVPSPGVFREWLRNLQKINGKLESMQFRRTDRDWGKGQEIYRFADGRVMEGSYYTQWFFANLILRDSCSSCKYCSADRPGDITLGDFWGIEAIHPEFMDDRGVSLVMLHTEKGLQAFQKIRSDLSVIPSSLQEAASQPRLQNIPVVHTPKKDEFWERYHRVGLRKVAVEYGFLPRRIAAIKRQVFRLLHITNKTEGHK